MLRRFTALLLMLCLGFFSVEALVADVHDGDATAAELQQDGASHGGAHVAHAGIAGQDEAAQAAVHAEDGGRSTRDDGRPVHTQHVCHCVHAHGVVDTAHDTSDAPDLPDASAPAVRPVRMPPSLEREPQLRPPIAA